MTALAQPLPVHVPSGRLLPAVWKLLVLRLRITWNTFRHAKLGKKILIIIGYLFLLGFAAGICFGSWMLLEFLRSPLLQQYVGLDVSPFLQTVPVLVFSGLFMGILLSSFGVLLQALYLSGDMDFLLTSPVPIRAVFVAKLLQAVLPNFGLIALFGLPVLYGLGLSEHYNILYYPLVILLMITLTLAAAGLSALLVMLVARILPPRRAAEILGFIGALLGFVCSQSGNLFNSLGRDVEFSGQQVNGMFGLLMSFNTPWFPLNWAGRGLVDLGEGRWLSGLLMVLLTLGLSAAAFMLSLATAERWYYTGWAGMQVVARKKKAARANGAAPAASAAAVSVPWLERLLPAPVRAIIRKDFLVMRRDLRNLSQLVSPLIFGVIYTLMFFQPSKTAYPNAMPTDLFANSMRFLLSYGSVGMALFVGWMLMSRLSGMAFSAEGKNYWILKSSPVRPRQLLLAKFLVAYLPTLALGLFFLAGISILQKVALADILYSLLAVVMCLAGMNGILLGFGVAGANFKWDDPRKMNAGNLGCLGQIVTMLYIPTAFGMFIGPLALASFFGWPLVFGYLAGALLGTAATVTAAVLPLALAQKKVERLDEA